ncbi:MAG: ATP-binding protein [Ignavibacteriae bacterium]|nr:ATP-binding protein [Ignavibacteriota bacterium]
MKIFNKVDLQPKSLILIFIAVAILVISSVLFEYYQSKKEMYNLMEEQAHSLLETTLTSSTNALISYDLLNSELKNRLFNNANYIKLLFEKGQINNNILKHFAEQNQIYRINIFNKFGKKIFSNHEIIHTDLEPKIDPNDVLAPIFKGITDSLFIGFKKARFEDGFRFAIAVSAKDRSAIVLNLNAEKILEFRKQIGFGSLLKKLTQNKNLIYTVLQNSDEIIAASGNISTLENFDDSDFLKKSLIDSTFASRVIENDSLNIFEAVHPFSYNGNTVGIFRLGISLQPLISINQRAIRRLVIIGITLFVLGSLLLTYIFTRQNFDFLQKRFRTIENFSNNVIQNVSDAVIVLDEDHFIKIVNSAAINLFRFNENEINTNKFFDLLKSNDLMDIINSNDGLKQLEIKINNQNRYLLLSKTNFDTESNNKNTIFVFRDLTKQKLLEDQIQRKERLVAMGELASGVAHEIRNPLNTISTITQQLQMDFEPIDRKDEFKNLAGLVNKEVKRINETVNSFLRFSKPEKIILTEFKLSDLTGQIRNLYIPMFSDKSIEFLLKAEWDGIVNWDRNQIQQVFMNLLQNSFDATKNNGNIILTINHEENNNIKIEIADNGIGISKNMLNKIFNLYFTTKAKGTGIGLSIVQRIIFEHGGTISVNSEENSGTLFTITLPQFPII